MLDVFYAWGAQDINHGFHYSVLLKWVKIVSAADIYERLREKISSWPVRVPKTKEVDEMLRVLFTEEEAEFLTHFTAPYQDGQTFDQIVEKIEFLGSLNSISLQVVIQMKNAKWQSSLKNTI